jgi:hypothetical protein
MTLKRALPFMYLKPNKATKPTIAVEISFFLSFFLSLYGILNWAAFV